MGLLAVTISPNSTCLASGSIDHSVKLYKFPVISNGLSFLSGLASTAPKQPLMFQTAVMDVGQSGKSALEISVALSIDCGKCLDAQLVTLRTIIGSKRGWEIYGSSCFMWYHDFQFYSNISITASEFCGYWIGGAVDQWWVL
ncbi:hypothetical protein CFP56_013160 [Quercus suber]|uniref:Uncharacterized protein n=1 Tax=Quercus suber TaxID=58331 RepID=A0AAW0KWS4_QUESU